MLELRQSATRSRSSPVKIIGASRSLGAAMAERTVPMGRTKETVLTLGASRISGSVTCIVGTRRHAFLSTSAVIISPTATTDLTREIALRESVLILVFIARISASVSSPARNATASTTVGISQMKAIAKIRIATPPVFLISSDAKTDLSAFRNRGSATEAKTARTDLTNRTTVNSQNADPAISSAKINGVNL